MADVIGADAVLLGIPGFNVRAAVESEGEVWVLVETAEKAMRCPDCGFGARSKGRREVEVRDLAVGGRSVRLRWRKRRLHCPNPDCDASSFTETHPEIRPRAVMTERARRWALDQVGQQGRTVASVARELGVGWHTVMAATRELGQPLLGQLSLAGTRALGMDEHRWRHRPEGWAMALCDLDTGRLIDVIEGRSGAGIGRYLATSSPGVRAQIKTVSIDPWQGYLGPIRRFLPQAEVVLDCFHVIRLANQVVTEVRQRTQLEVSGHRGRKGDPLFGIRRLLLRGQERLTEGQRQRITEALAHPLGDRWDEVACAWTAKELLRAVYRAPDLASAQTALAEFYRWAEEVVVPEIDRLARTVRGWEDEILAYHRHARISNAKTEAANLVVERQRRAGHGYRNFKNYRLRLLLTHGVRWDTRPTTKIRGRKPPSAA